MKGYYIIEKKALIKARPETVYGVLKHTESWHLWTKSIQSITNLNNGEITPGTMLKILQPKLKPAIWTITEANENNLLIWEKKSLGLKLTAIHSVERMQEGTTATLQMVYQGLLARLAYKVTKELAGSYLEMEIQGLKKWSEII